MGQGPVGREEGNAHQSSGSLQNAPVRPTSRCGAPPPTHLAPPTAPAPGCFLLYGRGQVWLPASDSGVKRHAKEEFDKYSHLKQHSYAHKAPGTSKQTNEQKVQIGEEGRFVCGEAWGKTIGLLLRATPEIHRKALKILLRFPETHPGLFLPGQKTSNYRVRSLFLIFFKKKKVYNTKKEQMKERERRVQRTCKTRRAEEFFKGKRENLQFAQEEKLASFTPEIVSCKIGWTHVSAGRGAAGRCEVACLNALRTFSCAEKSDSAPPLPLFLFSKLTCI